jgi:hypothetical protein
MFVQVSGVGAHSSRYGIRVPRLLFIKVKLGLKSGAIESGARDYMNQPGRDHWMAVAWVDERIAERGRRVGCDAGI